MEIAFSDDGKLGASITRLLSDKLYEKRKSGALQIEAIVRDLMRGAGVLSTASTGVGGGHNNTASLNNNQNSSNTSHQRIESLISVLTTDFTYSIVPNSRNGGLIGLAATAIALGPQIHLHLSTLVPPILSCFQDHDSRVRYYACESMYNIAKVARSQILLYFNEIFDALTKLSVDVELSVKNGAELLDRLIKDIVSEKSTFYISAATTASSAGTTTIDNVSSSTPTAASTGQSMPSVPGTVPVHGGPLTFNLPRFIPLLIERINVISAPSRLFLIQWIFVLHSVPDLELVSYLAEFLHGLLAYLSDPSVDVRTATLNVLGDFLREIGNVVQVQKQIGVVDVAALTASAIVEGQAAGEGETELSASNVKSSTPYTLGQSVTLDFGKMTLTLAQYLSTSADQETQAVCLKWINSFLGMAPSGVAMLPHTPLLLASILPILSHSVPTIRSLAIDVNSNLFSLVIEAGSSSKKEADSSSIKTADTASVGGGVGGGTSSSPSYNPFDIYTTVTTLMTQCLSPAAEETRLGSLEWLRMLHKKFPAQVLDADSGLFQTLLSALTDFSEEVVRCDLQLLAQISHSSDDSYFSKFMANLLALFSGDRRLLETRGGLIIRQLCLYLNPERMYRNFGEILEQESDLEFASTMIQTLNLIMITAPELGEMRRRLKSFESRDGISLFLSLYRSWCHNPISCFTLCLLCQAYEHASNLITMFGELEISVPFLIQTDKLVQLIESPVFTFLRLQLLDPIQYPYLYRCMYGILMLLPQSSAFATLRNRLNSLGSLATLSPIISQASNTAAQSSHSSASSAAATVQSAVTGIINPQLQKKKDKHSSSDLSLPLIPASKWQELLVHFKTTQSRHERARRLNNERHFPSYKGKTPI